MDVFIAHEKHGTFPYESASVIVQQRLEDGYWYYDEYAERAEAALADGEDAAWAFLRSRCDCEYEYVERATVHA